MRAHGATGTCGWAEKFLGPDLESLGVCLAQGV